MRQSWIYTLCIALMMVLVAGCDASNKKSGTGSEAAPAEAKQAPSNSAQGDSTGGGGTSGDSTSGGSTSGDSADTTSSAPAADSNSSLWVMQPRGNLQCEGGGRSLEASAAQLAENGIKVQESRCATRTDRMYPSVCGGVTGDLLVHRIPASFLDAALELGFDPAKAGQYQFGDCPEVKPGGSSAY